jgi:uncharacterized membrane protein YiaA
MAHNRKVQRRLEALERAGVTLLRLSWLLLVVGAVLALIGLFS